MRDRDAEPLRRKGEATDGRGRIEGFFLRLAAAHERSLAGRPGEGAVGMQRNAVDPAALGISRENRGLALGVECNDLAVVAAGDNARTVRRRAEDAAEMHLDRRNLA